MTRGRFVSGDPRQNPGGRARGGGRPATRRWRETIEEATDNGRLLIETALELIKDASVAPSIRLDAVKFLASHGYGQPTQSIELDAEIRRDEEAELAQNRAELDRLTLNEVKVLDALLGKAKNWENSLSPYNRDEEAKLLGRLDTLFPKEGQILPPEKTPVPAPEGPSQIAVEFEDAQLEPVPMLVAANPVSVMPEPNPVQTSVVPEIEAEVVEPYVERGPIRIQKLARDESFKPPSWRDHM